MVKVQKELRRERVCQKYGRGIDAVTFESESGNAHEFYIKNEQDAVCALALTPENVVILATQFRHGPQKILHELPAGNIEEGEDPEAAMMRELREETGYVGKITFVATIHECGYSNKKRYCFVITDCKPVGDQQLEEGEYIDTVLMNLSEFRHHLRKGGCVDIGVAYLGLDHLGLL